MATSKSIALVIADAARALAEGHPEDAIARLRALSDGAPQPEALPAGLLAQAEAADAAVESAKVALADAMAHRSNLAKTILATHGAGPFLIGGKPLTVIARDYGDGPSYFFRAMRGNAAKSGTYAVATRAKRQVGG